MTALPGGAADKSGNGYEALWTALRIADLLRGEASSLKIEPVGDDGLGIEFRVQVADETWGEQTKHSATTWTIKRLRDEGALAAAKHQVAKGIGYRLITSSAATALDQLSERARATTSLQVFESSLSEKLRSDFQDLQLIWVDPAVGCWHRLQQVRVEHHPYASLRRAVRQAFEILYAGDPDLVIAAVIAFCGEHLHETVQAPQVAAHLSRMGFVERLLAGDDNIRRLLHRTLERQQRQVHASAPGTGFVPRPEARDIVDDLTADGSPSVLLLDAPAGFGKSAVAMQVAAELEQRGWHVAVARLDNASTLPTSKHLGKQMGLDESPSTLLAGVSAGSPGLLVVDQLDAVSFFSGRMADSFDAVAEVVDELHGLPNLKLMLVCRTTDVENDPRLASLHRGDGDMSRRTLKRLDADALTSYLTDNGARVEGRETMELLRSPLHLSAYMRLDESSQQNVFRTLQDLYDALTNDVRRRAESRAGALDWQGITTRLVERMSDNESLIVRSDQLGEFSPIQVAALVSEGLLTSDAGKLAFFHESYFDYLFARAFVARNEDLHQFLAESGQFLFRRAQARQVLEYLAGTDRPRFRQVVGQLLTSPAIRAHLKQVVVGVLQRLDAEPEDWEAVEGVAWSDSAAALQLIALLNRPCWFEAADRLGRWEQWLNDRSRVDRAMNQLVIAARDHGKRVSELVRPHIGSSEEWRVWLKGLISWSLTSELVPLAVELIEGGHVDDARGPIAVNSDFWSLVRILATDDAAGAVHVTGAFLRRGLSRAKADGKGDPFESGHLDTHSTADDLFHQIAQQAPGEFLEEILPFVVEVAMVAQSDHAGYLPVGHRWGLRWRGTHYSVDDALFEAVESALAQLADEQPGALLRIIEPLRSVESEELRFLTCRALTALNDSDDAITWLTADPRNLVLGWADNPRWASRELIARHSPGCSIALYEQLERVILEHKSPFETKAVGHGQYVLLSGLDVGLLSALGKRRLGELGRRFDAAPSAPRPLEASFVGSPIPVDATKRMSDDNWLAALRKHDSEGTNWGGDAPVGGARELAQVLEQRAKEDPERFGRLALRFDASVPATAGAHLLRGVGSGLSLELLTDVCEHLATLYDKDVGRDICHVIQEAEPASPRLVALIERYARSSDPDKELARTPASGGEPYFGGDLFMAGLNCTRGGAALAAASVLFGPSPHLTELAPVVERLATDPILAVRTCAANAVAALLNHDEAFALSLIEALLDAPIDILDARTTERLLTYAILRAPDRFSDQLGRAIHAGRPIAKRGGRIWAVAAYRGILPVDVPTAVERLPTGARVGAAKVLADLAADAHDELAGLFNDPDEDVRKAASFGMRHVADLAPDTANTLVARFVVSAAFPDHMDYLFRALGELGTRLPPSTLSACRRAAEVSGSELGDIRTARAAVADQLIKVVLRLYRQGDGVTRAGCLDVIDMLTVANAFGIEEALAHER